MPDNPDLPVETNLTPEGWATLIPQIQRGEGVGMERLYAYLEQPKMLGYIGQHVPEADARDVINDIFVAAVTALHDHGEEIRDPQKYINGIAHNIVSHKIRDAISARRKSSKLPLDGLETSDSADIEGGILHSADREAVRKTIGLMVNSSQRGGAYRRSGELLKAMLENKTRKEICEEYQLSSQQLRVRYSRANERLRKILENKEGFTHSEKRRKRPEPPDGEVSSEQDMSFSLFPMRLPPQNAAMWKADGTKQFLKEKITHWHLDAVTERGGEKGEKNCEALKCFMEGQSIKQIAEAMDTTSFYAKQYLTGARKVLTYLKTDEKVLDLIDNALGGRGKTARGRNDAQSH